MYPTSTYTRLLQSTLTPFLYPCLDSAWAGTSHHATSSLTPRRRPILPATRHQSTVAATPSGEPTGVDISQYDHLDPQPPDYSSAPFTDACTLTIHAGAGGHGCISFLREKYIANGPPNGGDGGTGGNVYIQAVRGETSLHKIARRGTLRAGRGRNGQGSLKGGSRGEDVVLNVPVGTVIREVWRRDPLAEENAASRRNKGYGADLRHDDPDAEGSDESRKWRRDKWLLYPGTLPKSFTSADFPALPRPRRSNLVATEPAAPLRLDLDKPMDRPMLLTAGAMGGLGNPHFVTKSILKPKYATKGEDPTRVHLQLELKLLADVGLVGLPNAGKSTVLRSLTNSRTRVGDWAFTTLAPSVGTVVLDRNYGRPSLETREHRRSFTIADIPGLVEDAHLDRGLGLGFLRHVERAAVLAFVIDLSAGDAVAALKALWKEVAEYEKLREEEVNAGSQRVKPDEDGMITFQPYASSISPTLDPEPADSTPEDDDDNSGTLLLDPPAGQYAKLPPLALPAISSKPWFVVATKADLPGTQENFLALQQYLQGVQGGAEAHGHPSGKANAWRRDLRAVPVSAMKKEGVEGIPGVVVGLLGA
ncbi:GTPase of the mitochondrial inner membrane that associates with the large ribosomal subunit [Teratosphaeriaceae sp. CCFEE 6253]|nr:GTPase of the mitochondrial inner membrane that associates with the large ribosomal subunit [Teratosphaeriaceae sp. CCFEE 6253]